MAREHGAPLRVALLGCGVVGSAVATRLIENADDLAARVGAPLELVGIAVRRPQRPRPEVPVDPSIFTADAEELVTRADIVIEVIGGLDPARGIRQFVAGMGGASHYSFGTIQPNSEARNSDTYGVLKLTLRSDGYDWQFVPEAGKSYADAGSGTCH